MNITTKRTASACLFNSYISSRVFETLVIILGDFMDIFETLVKGLNDIVLRFDKNLCITYASESVIRMWKKPSDEVIHRSLAEVAPNDECLIAWSEAINRVFTSKSKSDFEVTCEEKTFLVQLIPEVGKNGSIEQIIAVSRDITEEKKLVEELKENEARLLDVHRLVQLGYWWWDVKSGEVEWSDEVYKIFHLDPKKFTPQIDSIQALSPWPEEHQRDKELIDKAINNHEVGSYEQKFLYPDGSIGFYLSTFAGVYDGGELVAIKGTVQNITDRKRAEEERDRLEKQYQQAQKTESIGRLAGGIAHDLNNLLTPIIGCSELLEEDLREKNENTELVREILKAGLKARELVSQLLAYGRRQTLEYKVVNLNDTIKGFFTLLRRTIRENIDINLDLTDEKPTISADIGQIEQVMMNLCVNAQDAMPKGGKLTIETALAQLDENYADAHLDVVPGNYALLAVSDTGAGIDDETKSKMFEPFFSTKGELGTGLGLATVYGVIKQHKGNVFVYSEQNIGTTIKIYLPLSEKSPTEDIPTNFSPAALRGTETILVVEDNVHVRTMTKSILQRQGYEVIVAHNGKEAISLLKKHNEVQLLLTDVIMPEMNGKELYNTAVKSFPQLKVLYMSGYTDNVIASSGVIDSGIAFIAKPFTKETLAIKVREALNKE